MLSIEVLAPIPALGISIYNGPLLVITARWELRRRTSVIGSSSVLTTVRPPWQILDPPPPPSSVVKKPAQTQTYALTTFCSSDESIHLVPQGFVFDLEESAYSTIMQCSVLSGHGISLSSSGWYHCMQIRPSFGCVTKLSSGAFAGTPSTLICWTGSTTPGESSKH